MGLSNHKRFLQPDGSAMLVTEYMEHGDLHRLLQKERETVLARGTPRQYGCVNRNLAAVLHWSLAWLSSHTDALLRVVGF